MHIIQDDFLFNQIGNIFKEFDGLVILTKICTISCLFEINFDFLKSIHFVLFLFEFCLEFIYNIYYYTLCKIIMPNLKFDIINISSFEANFGKQVFN